jgi:hypothetical protein
MSPMRTGTRQVDDETKDSFDGPVMNDTRRDAEAHRIGKDVSDGEGGGNTCARPHRLLARAPRAT